MNIPFTINQFLQVQGSADVLITQSGEIIQTQQGITFADLPTIQQVPPGITTESL